jgi:DnaJ-class molecular chaperone
VLGVRQANVLHGIISTCRKAGFFVLRRFPMSKKKISTKCQVCRGKGVVPTDETFVMGGKTRVYHIPCDACNGRGKETRWVDEQDAARVLSVFKKATVEVDSE